MGLSESMGSIMLCCAAMAPSKPSEPFHIMDFKSRRSPVLGRRGMVASSQPLASEASPSTVLHARFSMYTSQGSGCR